MTLLKKIGTGIFLFIGLPITLFAIVSVINPSTSAKDREGAAAALVFFGLPPTVLGGWLVWNLHQQHQGAIGQLAREQEQLFLELLKAQGGKLTALQFATAAKIPFAEAKTYLDQKAVQMNAVFDVTETGGITYRFPE
jgi:hypothetical protein